MKDILSKLKNNELLTESDNKILLETIKEQDECVKYYSQNFVGTWNCDDVNVNWRAKKCTDNIKNKTEQIKQADMVVIDIEVTTLQQE